MTACVLFHSRHDVHDNKLQVIDCKLHIIVHLSVNTSCDNNPIIITIYKNQYIPSFCVDYYYIMCVLRTKTYMKTCYMQLHVIFKHLS